MPNKKTLFFFVLVVITFVLMTFQSKKGRVASEGFLDKLLNSSHMASKSVTDAVTRPFARMALREEENIRLKKSVEALLLEREKYQETLLENKRLRELLKLRETQKNHITSARVIARGIDHWANTFIIDKGTKDGVAKDMSAVTPKGLAGKVFKVSDSYSYLLSLTDINFSAAVRLQGSRREGVLSGTGARKCSLKYIPYEDEIKPGDVVVTSGLDMLFPPGIQVGYVSKVDSTGRGGSFQYVEVVPFQDDTRLEEVIIVR